MQCFASPGPCAGGASSARCSRHDGVGKALYPLQRWAILCEWSCQPDALPFCNRGQVSTSLSSRGPRRHRPLWLAASAGEGAAAPPAGAAEGEAAEADDFNWRLAVALAGCSFESYLDVNSSDDAGLKERSAARGSEVTYVDDEFLQAKLGGLLEVYVKGCTSLPAVDMWPGSSSPYAEVTIGDGAYATPVVKNSLDPAWDACAQLYVHNPRAQRLAVKVLSASGLPGGSPKLLGSALRGLADVCDGEPHTASLPLRGGACGAGGDAQVHFAFKFRPFTDVLAEEAAAGGPVQRVVGSHSLLDNSWRELQTLCGLDPSHADFLRPVAFIENTISDTQAWLYWNPAARRACIAFRGTEQAKWKDILTDLSLVPAALNPERVKEATKTTALAEASQEPNLMQRVMSHVESAKAEVSALKSKVDAATDASDEEASSAIATAIQAVQETASDVQAVLDRVRGAIAAAEAAGAEEEGDPQPWVHHGFLQAYDSIRPQVISLVDTLLEDEEEPWTLYITGHSLGGALATLCAYDLALRTWPSRKRPAPRLVMYNYGSPRVGNRTFAREFNRLVPNAWRVVNGNDAVVTVPRLLGYCHVGHAVRVSVTGEVDIQKDTSDAPGEGTTYVEVLPAITAAVTPNMPELASRVLSQVGLELAAAASQGSGDAAEEGEQASPAQKLLNAEMESWQSLVDGSGLNEHLEDLYLESIKAFVAKNQEA